MNNIKLAPLVLIFAEVAKERSFTKAAKKIGMSKSAVSQQIKRLENGLAIQLLARNTRGVVPTAAGERLLERSALFSEQLSSAIQDTNLSKEQPSGRFKISVPPFFERYTIVPALKQLCLEFPMIQPELVVTGRWQDLIEHELDVAIFGGDLKDCDYKAQPIGKVHDIFCASPLYLEKMGEPETLEQLLQHRYIASPWQPKRVIVVDQKDHEKSELDMAHFAHTNSVIALVDLTLAGLGVGMIPEFLAMSEINRGTLRQILPNYRGREWHFYLLHRYKNNKPVHIERFYQLIKHHFTAMNYRK